MNTDVQMSDKFVVFLGNYTKEQICYYSLAVGTLMGILLYMLGISGVLILAGVYFLLKYFGNKKTE